MNETLTAAVDRLSDEAADIRAQLRSRTRALWTAIIVGGIVLLVVIAAAVAVSLDNKEAIAANNLRWCPVVLPLAPRAEDPPPVGTPEQQERAVRIRVAFSKLVTDFGCK